MKKIKIKTQSTEQVRLRTEIHSGFKNIAIIRIGWISISVAWLNLLLIIISECHGRQQITQAGRPAGMESETSTTRTSFAYFVAHINCEWFRANSKQRNTHTHRLLYSQSIASQVNFWRADWPPQDMDGNTKNVRRINARSPQRWSAHKDDGNSEYASWNWIVGNQCQHTGMEIFSLSLYVSFRFLHSLHRQNHKSKTRTRETKKNGMKMVKAFLIGQFRDWSLRVRNSLVVPWFMRANARASVMFSRSKRPPKTISILKYCLLSHSYSSICVQNITMLQNKW